MTARILLVRHGRSAHVQRGWLDRDGLDRWHALYDAAALHDEDGPPEAVRALARQVGCVVASDLPRAIASAERLLGPGVAFETVPLLREARPWTPAWRRVRLPLRAWSMLTAFGSWWRQRHGLWPGAAEAERARAAATLLHEMASRRGSVLAVTHGAFRVELTDALLERGWAARRTRGYHHWSVWELVRAGR